MRLIDRVLGREEASRSQMALVSGWAPPNAERLDWNWTRAVEAFLSNPIISGLVQTRIGLFSQAELKFQRKADKSLFGTEALLPLEQPWTNGTTSDLLSRMLLDTDTAGNSYHVLHPDGTVERLRPDTVTIITALRSIDDDLTDERTVREVVGYFYDATDDPDRKPFLYLASEVAHWAPLPDPRANFRGMSWLTPVLREIAADDELSEHKRAYLQNAATPNLVIKYSQELKKDSLDKVSAAIRAKHTGIGQAYKTLILDAGADPMVLGNSLEQMAFADVQGAGETRLATAAQVPPVIAGLREGMTSTSYNFYSQAMRRFADLTMRPLWASACAALAPLVEVPSDSRLWHDVTAVSALQQGEKEAADTMFVNAQAAQALITAGYTPDSVVTALSASDMTLLKHTGLVSVQMQQPGKTATTKEDA